MRQVVSYRKQLQVERAIGHLLPYYSVTARGGSDHAWMFVDADRYGIDRFWYIRLPRKSRAFWPSEIAWMENVDLYPSSLTVKVLTARESLRQRLRYRGRHDAEAR